VKRKGKVSRERRWERATNAVNHRVDGQHELQDFAVGLDHDLLRQVTLRDSSLRVETKLVSLCQKKEREMKKRTVAFAILLT
jgi:Zn-finger domain-containing protein